jgi:hypothetical protein
VPREWILTPGPLALVGSGEYLPVMTSVEGLLLRGRAPRYVQIPSAAAPEGELSLRRWLDLGAAQAAGRAAGARRGLSRTGRSWQVHGRQQAWILADGPRRGHPAGTSLATPGAAQVPDGQG